MPPSTVSTANLLTRRSAHVLFGLQKTPMFPTGTGAAEHDADPQMASGNIIESNTRHFYPSWPEGSVFKSKSDFSINSLKFRCRSFGSQTGGDTGIYLEEDYALGILGGNSPLTFYYDPAVWTSGDDKVYSEVTIITNIYRGKIDDDGNPATPDVDVWDIVTTVWQMDSVGNIASISGNVIYNSTTKITTGDSSLLSGNSYVGGIVDLTNYDIYGTFSGEVDYDEMHLTYPKPDPMDDDYSSAGQVFRSIRGEDQDPHGLNSYMAVLGLGVYAKDTTGGQSFKNGLYTYVLNDTDTPAVATQKNLVRGRWRFEPQGCSPCPYAGKVVTVEAKFKQATVTRSLSASTGLTLSLGTWSDHSTQTFTLTLPDSLAAQDLGSDFDFPTSPGKVVVLDDLKLVSIA